MTWAYVGVGAATVIGGAINQHNASEATDKAGKKISSAQDRANALNEQRYLDAQKTLSPYLLSSSVANRQLINELGLGGAYDAAANKQQTDNLSQLKQQLSDLQTEQAQANAQYASAKKKNGGGGLLGKMTGITSLSDLSGEKVAAGGAGRALSRYLLTGNSQSPGTKPAANYDSAIADVQKQISDAQAQISQAAPQGDSNNQTGAYMNTPAYKGAIDAGVKAVDQGAANGGGLYSGARGVALRDVGQGVQQSFYSNYMNMLQNMANPATATNLSNIGIGQAGQIGTQNIASANNVNGYNIMGTEANNAANADMVGGLTSAFTAYMNRPNQKMVSSNYASMNNPSNQGNSAYLPNGAAYNTLPVQPGQV